MKNEYQTPKINVELLEKTDVIMGSVDTDNRYKQSGELLSNFSIQSLL